MNDTQEVVFISEKCSQYLMTDGKNLILSKVSPLTWCGLTQEELRLGYRVPGSMVYCSKFLAMFSGVVCGRSL